MKTTRPSFFLHTKNDTVIEGTVKACCAVELPIVFRQAGIDRAAVAADESVQNGLCPIRSQLEHDTAMTGRITAAFRRSIQRSIDQQDVAFRISAVGINECIQSREGAIRRKFEHSARICCAAEFGCAVKVSLLVAIQSADGKKAIASAGEGVERGECPVWCNAVDRAVVVCPTS